MVRTNYPHYFNAETNFEKEKVTIAGIYDEATILHGAECVWYDTTLDLPDEIFGEFLGKKISLGTPIKLLVDQIEEDFYPEDGGMHGKFAIELNIGEATFRATKQYFDHFNINPKAQDLILYKKVHKLFEVTHITLLNDFNYQIDAIFYNHDHIEIDDTVEEEEVLSLKDINDQEIEKIITPIIEQSEEEEVIDESSGDGLFD